MLERILQIGEGRAHRRFQRLVAAVNAAGDEVAGLTDPELAERSQTLKARAGDGEPLDDLQVAAFALVREAAHRTLGQRPFDVQVFGAAVLHAGHIAEMSTGEGKTLTSTMPAYLNALTGRGVHIVTVNDYLAQRDAAWMGQVHRFLGLTVGVISPDMSSRERQAAYACDITYGTNSEFGFDYLRDNLAMDTASQVQRGRHLAIIDEVDSILIDEARTPLIIAGTGRDSTEAYRLFAQAVARLQRGQDGLKPGEEDGDYLVDIKNKTIVVTEQGFDNAERLLGVDSIHAAVDIPMLHYLTNALRAKELFLKDRDYLIAGGEVVLIDEHTGRALVGRRYSDGLHQALEAKERLRVNAENQTIASVTLQNYYRSYERLAGMTGTAKTEEAELSQVYRLPVAVVPTNRPCIRIDHPDVVHVTWQDKIDAIVDEIVERHETGQPILIGTTFVETSEKLSKLLRKRGIKHQTLNAKNPAREAEIVAQAGRLGSVTVSTNMAGRGTDILLGGNPDGLASREIADLDPELDDVQLREATGTILTRYRGQCAAERDQVIAVGGLCVIGTAFHDAHRIDNQLRGRAGRQGDPGESLFHLSLQDDLARRNAQVETERLLDRCGEEGILPAGAGEKLLNRAQRQAEVTHRDERKEVLKYDEVLDRQRTSIYQRRQALVDKDESEARPSGLEALLKTVEQITSEHCPDDQFPEDWDLSGLESRLRTLHDRTLGLTDYDPETLDKATLLDRLRSEATDAYRAREHRVGGEHAMRELERRVLLTVIDRRWQDHLSEIEELRDGVQLRAYAQQEPIVAYRLEAYQMFTGMLTAVQQEAATYIMQIPADDAEDAQQTVPLLNRTPLNVRRAPNSPADAATAGGHAGEKPPGRNTPCPCGSGTKYKRCHGA